MRARRIVRGVDELAIEPRVPMNNEYEAIFENGVLRPTRALELKGLKDGMVVHFEVLHCHAKWDPSQMPKDDDTSNLPKIGDCYEIDEADFDIYEDEAKRDEEMRKWKAEVAAKRAAESKVPASTDDLAKSSPESSPVLRLFYVPSSAPRQIGLPASIVGRV